MIVALAGGVGGAKLADGLYQALPPDQLTIVVNTADDFTLHGLAISPDLDTVLYTLAGLANPQTGWGVRDETFHGLEMLARYGGPDWFRLGDRDLATHITRTALLREGATLTQVTERLARALGVQARLLPMCDEQVATIVETPDGPLAFQEYFVHRQCRDTVTGIRLEGIEQARISAALDQALGQAEAIIFCPSNPFVSIEPILRVGGLRERLRALGVPIVAVSPIVAGQALKGPAARMLEDLGQDTSVAGIAALYADLNLTLFIDERDRALAPAVRAAGARPVMAPIIMQDQAARVALARRVLAEIPQLRAQLAQSGDGRHPSGTDYSRSATLLETEGAL
ncbi:MAG TPA: 2-phospho-L-lactate transferase [Chloroflexota bacterium]|jgi:LPPG:FO 2-phospho-L-lactate transferase|nr:2-phospho-L-lactate transferase [Chloroflexota bacterium]